MLPVVIVGSESHRGLDAPTVPMLWLERIARRASVAERRMAWDSVTGWSARCRGTGVPLLAPSLE